MPIYPKETVSSFHNHVSLKSSSIVGSTQAICIELLELLTITTVFGQPVMLRVLITKATLRVGSTFKLGAFATEE